MEFIRLEYFTHRIQRPEGYCRYISITSSDSSAARTSLSGVVDLGSILSRVMHAKSKKKGNLELPRLMFSIKWKVYQLVSPYINRMVSI